MTATTDQQAEPLCNHPGGTTLGHKIPDTPMWAVKDSATDKPVWFCPDCRRSYPREDPAPPDGRVY